MPPDRPWYRRPVPIILAVIMAAVVAGFVIRARRSGEPMRETIAVARRDIVREVRVTGTVEPASEVALAFDVVGRIVRVGADVGDDVRAGAELVVLDGRDAGAELARARAALATARADLAELRSGKRPEEIAAARVDVENARRAVAEAEARYLDAKRKGIADLAAIATDAPNELRSAYAKVDDAVRKQTDDLFTNDATQDPQLTFQTSDYQARIDAVRERSVVEGLLRTWNTDVAIPASPVDDADRDTRLATASARLGSIQGFLDLVAAALNGATNVPAATLATYKANVNTGRANVNTARTAVEDLRQAIAAQDAANASALGSARTDDVAKRNALAAAESQLTLVSAPATAAQREAQEARVAAAAAEVAAADAQLQKTVLRAPFSGTVTVRSAEVGAAVTAGTTLVRMISAEALEITANVPEVDVADVMVGATAHVTLDAYGDDVVFSAVITAIDPAATIVESVPTYRTTFAFADRDARVRVGMTANATIAVAQRTDVIAVPLRSVIFRDGSTHVRVVRGTTATDQLVRIGLRGSDGFVEVVEGLSEGAVIERSPSTR